MAELATSVTEISTRPRARNNDAPRQPVTEPTPLANDSDVERIAAFGKAIEALRSEIEAQVGEPDAQHIRRIGKLSQRLEILGRGLIHVSLDPLTFGVGTTALAAHKLLELMEIGHMALHGAYDGLPQAERFQSDGFHWKAPVDEASWKQGHNVRHHQYTNIEGKDPDLNFGALRLSPRVPYRAAHALQPITNVLTWFGFTTAINMHVTGMLDVYLKQGESEVHQDPSAEEVRKVQRTFFAKWLRYYGREYVFFPLLAGPFFPKVMIANLLSDVTRDLYAGAIIYCGHVGARDFENGTEAPTRAHWYVMQAEAARDVRLPQWMSILAGGLDYQIEHHLFPRLPPNRLRQIAPRVREICAAHGVEYLSDSWPRTLRSIFADLRKLGSRDAAPSAA